MSLAELTAERDAALDLAQQACARADAMQAQRDVAIELLESALAALRGNVKHAAIAAVRGGA